MITADSNPANAKLHNTKQNETKDVLINVHIKLISDVCLIVSIVSQKTNRHPIQCYNSLNIGKYISILK